MITLSVDPHPGSHTVAALDPNGATLASTTVSNTADGLRQLHQFAVPFARRRWAIEGAGNHTIAVLVGQLGPTGPLGKNTPLSKTTGLGLLVLSCGCFYGYPNNAASNGRFNAVNTVRGGRS